MLLPDAALAEASPLRLAIRDAHRVDEALHVERLAEAATQDERTQHHVSARARELVDHIRAQRRKVGNIDALMQEYDLSSAEGVTLMCLAEALLRIPDAATQDAFIEDQLGRGDWASHLGASDSFFANAATFGLMMAGRTVSIDEEAGPIVARLVRRLGEPVIRQAVRRAMRVLGDQFVMGRTIEQAIDRAKPYEAKGYRYSYDMLGEAARTAADAERYFEAYSHAIRATGAAAKGRSVYEAPGVSVKLSALHPRFEHAQLDRVMTELKDRLIALAELAASQGVSLFVDAEEADRLEPSLDLIEAAAAHSRIADWDGLGLAVQAYQKRAYAVLEWLEALARRTRRRLLVRLVKGAYWDSEIKRAQERGFPDYPVFTRKAHTDVSYLACARRMLDAGMAIYPCFATHNAVTLATLLEMAGPRRDLEFQRLHGMGEALYQRIVEGETPRLPCRIYAPVGGHEELLAYLVRRLLENGANSSFVNRISDDSLPIDEIVRDPVALARSRDFARHPRIPLPADLFGATRRNSAGLDLADLSVLATLKPAMEAADRPGRSAPIVGGGVRPGTARAVTSPADRGRTVGEVVEATVKDAEDALVIAAASAEAWNGTPVAGRAAVLRRASDLMEARAPALMTLIVREAGRTVADAHLEVREAVDFLRYYAAEAERLFAAPAALPGPTGESNTLAYAGRGPFLAIAPWNFPLAIFTGQVAAALAAGCPVLAKPAEQTPLIAAEAVRILEEAGVPPDVLHLLPGDGPVIGAKLLPDPRLAGVVFTGSFEAARTINRMLASRAGGIIPLIAETGGVNAMIVDSTALPEQVTRDVLSSAFQSAGQRCSSLRLLCVQEDVADRQLAMISGAMAELRVGDPALLSTDVGPIIDEDALSMLEGHKAEMAARFRLVAEASLGAASAHGLFFPPVAFEIDAVESLTREVFGPILHVVRWKAGDLYGLIDRINALGYGLTLSLHSRSKTRIAKAAARARVGNVYVNRNQIGAVVGVQPFGGEGMSGTGPKAGGPNYLLRFAVERALAVDTTASGGNASLMTLG